MHARTYTSTLDGMEGILIDVEVNLSKGLPYTHIVGYTDNVINESIERIRATLINCGYQFPASRVTINLAPAYMKKRGSHYDLPIAVSVLSAAQMTKIKINMKEYAFFGELALDGKINPVRGLLPLAMCAEEHDIKNIVVPYDNRYEVSLLEKSNILLVKSFGEVVEILEGKEEKYRLNFQENILNNVDNATDHMDFSQVYGQENVKQALTVAAAGGHSILMMGSPGTGKTMLAQRFIDILPPLTYQEQVDIIKVYSIGGLMKEGKPLINQRPFRMPHNSITSAAFFGGGREPKPGEISYAHNGVLFLDELQLFDKKIIDLMRTPLEDKEITLTRNRHSYVYPADVILVAAANPCKCGYRGDPIHVCTCTKTQMRSYLDKMSGPFVDRIDMHVRMNVVDYEAIDKKQSVLTTAQMKKSVMKAREIQKERYKNEKYNLNSHLDEEGIKKFIQLDNQCNQFMKDAYETMGLSVRAYNRILKVARTIADINNEEKISICHLAEAIQYRNLGELYRHDEFERYDELHNQETIQSATKLRWSKRGVEFHDRKTEQHGDSCN